MAIFLIKETNNVHPDPAQDVMCYKRGDIVQVLDDSAHDGDLVRNPITGPFMLVKVLGLTKEQAEKFMSQDETITTDAEGRTIVTTNRRRLYKIRLDDVPLSIRNQLINYKYIELTVNQIRNYVRNKVTNLDGIN